MSIIGTLMKDGLMKSFKKSYKFGLLYRGGKQVGADRFGNKYFINPENPQGQNRYVEISAKYPNGSQIPPEWYDIIFIIFIILLLCYYYFIILCYSSYFLRIRKI